MTREIDRILARDVYDDIAEEYAGIIDSKDANAFYEKPAMLGLAPNVSGLRVLDAGCGPGVYSEWLLDHGASVVGVDYSAKMVELAMQRTKSRGIFRVADLSSPMEFLKDSEFDMVLCPLVLHYIRDWVPVFREFCRVLKSEGRLLFSCYHPCFSGAPDGFDNYFLVQRISEVWGSGFSKRFVMPSFHHSLTTIFSSLIDGGFRVDRVSEPTPTEAIRQTDPEFYLKLLGKPLFLCVLATKQGPPRNRVIRVSSYDPEWAAQFVRIRDVLAAHLGPVALAVEHVGSTAVPGLAAKPILDIVIVIAGSDNFGDAIAALSQLGYYHQGDLGVSGREAFARQDGKVPWTGSDQEWLQHHLYVCGKNSPALASHLAFRDYLRQHPDNVSEYAAAKIRAAELYPHDINGYMNEKTRCLEAILKRATS